MATETKPVPGAPDSTNGLEQQGLRPSGQVHWNLVSPELMAIKVGKYAFIYLCMLWAPDGRADLAE